MADRHPIEERHDLPTDRRVQLLEIHLAQLWDMVWWVTLPWYRRLYWRVRGFRAPIQRFYREGD